MKHMMQPSAWSCIPTSFGMCLDLTPAEVMEAIGHDGSEIRWPDRAEPHNRRMFFWEECIPICLDYLRFPVHVERFIGYVPEGCSNEIILDQTALLESMMGRVDGVILGITKNGKPHACAWNFKENKVYDPEGGCGNLNEYQVEHFIGLF